MKTIQSKLILLVFLLSVSFAAEAKTEKQSVLFNVPMHCHSCQQKIEKNLAYERGVLDLKTSLEKQTVEVTYNADKTNVETLQAAIKKLGYSATPIIENESKK